MAAYGDKSTLDVIADVYARFRSTNAEVSVSAVKAMGAIRTKPAVGTLIDWVLGCESIAPISNGKQKWPAPSKETQAVYAKCKEAIVAILQAHTGKPYSDYKDWKDWWKVAERSFTFPDPAAK